MLDVYTAGLDLKYVSLVILIFQNATLILSVRYTRTLGGNMYISTTAVVAAEVMKVVACVFILVYQRGSLLRFYTLLMEQVLRNWKDTLKLSVPALLYTLQNNLQYVAVSNLDAATFQVSCSPIMITSSVCGQFVYMQCSVFLRLSARWLGLYLVLGSLDLAEVQVHQVFFRAL